MFIEDCARCETLADKRRREGFYKHFYRTSLTETAELSSDDLPEEIQSAAPVHLAIDDTTLEDESADVASVSELWEQIGTGEHPGKLCQTPLVHYIDREDCYIHAEPTRVGFSYGLPVFVYKRRQSDNHYGVFFSSEGVSVALWVDSSRKRILRPERVHPITLLLEGLEPIHSCP